jgi:hypothetical protein
MGWTKRDADVKYVREQHASREKQLQRLAASKQVDRATMIPEVMDSYISLCHMVGTRPNDDLIDSAFRQLHRATPSVQLRRR